MIDSWSAAALLLGFSTVGIPLFFYWTVREEWIAAIPMSAVCWAGSFWLTCFCAMRVVFPFVKTATESTTAEEGGTVRARVGRDTKARWIMGIVVPLVIMLLYALSLLFYPRDWIGALILGVWLVFLFGLLQYYYFFADPRESFEVKT